MQQVTSLDARALAAETPTATGQLGALVIVDPATEPAGPLTLEAWRDRCASRLHLLPRLRQQLVEVPLGLGLPYWVDDTEFDLEFHLREITLPGPGDARQLAEQTSRIHSLPLDRTRPLWEAYLIHGLENDGVAIYTKIHHLAIDAESGVGLLEALLDADAEPGEREVPEQEWEPGTPPSQPGLLVRGLASGAGRLLTSPPRSMPHLIDLPGARHIAGARTVSELADTLVALAARRVRSSQTKGRELTVPPTPLNGRVTAHRRIGYGSLLLADIEAMAAAYEVTVNDVVMAMTATVLRRWLLDHDALPLIPLVVALPVSSAAEDDNVASDITVILAELPTHLADPGQRVEEVARSLAVAAQRHDVARATPAPTDGLPSAIAVSALTLRSLFRQVAVPGRPFNLFVSFVSGPQPPLYIAGRRVNSVHPLSAVSDVTGGLGIALFGYEGRLDIALMACRELVPDVWNLIDYYADALAELVGRPA